MNNRLMEPPFKRQQTRGGKITDPNLQYRRVRNDTRLKSIFESIFDKYGKDFGGVGDEIDLRTGEIVVDNGHVAGIRNEHDTGLPDYSDDGISSDESSEAGLEDEEGDHEERSNEMLTIGGTGGSDDETILSRNETNLQALLVVDSLVEDADVQSGSVSFRRSLLKQVEDYDSEQDELADKGVEWVTPRETRAIANQKWRLPEDGPTFIDETATEEAWRAPPLPKSTSVLHNVGRSVAIDADKTLGFWNSKHSVLSSSQTGNEGRKTQAPDWSKSLGPDTVLFPQSRVLTKSPTDKSSYEDAHISRPRAQWQVNTPDNREANMHIAETENTFSSFGFPRQSNIPDRTQPTNPGNPNFESVIRQQEPPTHWLSSIAQPPYYANGQGKKTPDHDRCIRDLESKPGSESLVKHNRIAGSSMQEIIDLTSDSDDEVEKSANGYSSYPPMDAYRPILQNYRARPARDSSTVPLLPLFNQNAMEGLPSGNCDHCITSNGENEPRRLSPSPRPSSSTPCCSAQPPREISPSLHQFSPDRSPLSMRTMKTSDDAISRKNKCIDQLKRDGYHVVSQAPSTEIKGTDTIDRPYPHRVVGSSPYTGRENPRERGDNASVDSQPNGSTITNPFVDRQSLIENPVPVSNGTPSTPSRSISFEEDTSTLLSPPLDRRQVVRVIIPLKANIGFELEEKSRDDLSTVSPLQLFRTAARSQDVATIVTLPKPPEALDEPNRPPLDSNSLPGLEIPDSQADSSSPVVESAKDINLVSLDSSQTCKISRTTPPPSTASDRQLTNDVAFDRDLIDELSLVLEPPKERLKRPATSPNPNLDLPKNAASLNYPPSNKRKNKTVAPTYVEHPSAVAIDIFDGSEDELSFM